MPKKGKGHKHIVGWLASSKGKKHVDGFLRDFSKTYQMEKEKSLNNFSKNK